MLIRKLRLQRGWSQEHLAELTGLSVRTIQRAERGGALSLESRNALSAVFEIDFSNFEMKEQAMSNNNQQGEGTGDEGNEQKAGDGQKEGLDQAEADAIEYVQGIKSFYQHVLFYAFFIVFFAGGIYMVHRFIPVYIQFMIVGWGFGVIFHGLNAYEVINFFNPNWEKKRIEKRLGRKL